MRSSRAAEKRQLSKTQKLACTTTTEHTHAAGFLGFLPPTKKGMLSSAFVPFAIT
jgi:hypothetical protein